MTTLEVQLPSSRRRTRPAVVSEPQVAGDSEGTVVTVLPAAQQGRSVNHFIANRLERLVHAVLWLLASRDVLAVWTTALLLPFVFGIGIVLLGLDWFAIAGGMVLSALAVRHAAMYAAGLTKETWLHVVSRIGLYSVLVLACIIPGAWHAAAINVSVVWLIGQNLLQDR